MNKTTREEIKGKLVADKFFAKSNWGLKIRQILLTLLAWCGLFIPFVWFFMPSIFKNDNVGRDFYISAKEILRLENLGLFFLVTFFVIAIISVILTFRNNYRFRNTLRKEKQYDETLLEKRKEALEAFYTERFGSKEERENSGYYSVPAEKNINDDEIVKLFQDKEVPL